MSDLGERAKYLGEDILAWAGAKSFEDWRKYFVNLVIVIGLGLMTVVSCNAITEDLTVVEQVAVPKSLEEQGYTGKIVAQRLIDSYEHISSTARTRVGRAAIGRASRFSSLASIEVPSADISVHEVISLVRNIFREEDDKIGGEILVIPKTDKVPEHYEYRLRFDVRRDTPRRPGNARDSRHTVAVVKNTDLNELIASAAEKVVEQTNPIVLASYLHAVRRWADLDPLLDRLRASPKKDIGPRAQLMYGMRLMDQGLLDDGKDHIEQSVDKRKTVYTIVRYGDALADIEKYDAAIKAYEEAHELDFGKRQRPWTWFYRQFFRHPANPLPLAAWAEALHKNNQHDLAIKKLQEAERIAVRDPRIFVTWGTVLADHPQRAKASLAARTALDKQAIGKYQQAILYEPRNWHAHMLWGFVLWRAGDTKGALAKLEAAIDASPAAAEAHYLKGHVLLDDHRGDEAITSFLKATAVDSEFIAGFLTAVATLERQEDEVTRAEKFQKAGGIFRSTFGKYSKRLFLSSFGTAFQHRPSGGAATHSQQANLLQK